MPFVTLSSDTTISDIVIQRFSESSLLERGRSRLTSTASDLDGGDGAAVLLARLTAAERRVAHLSSLLGESETENARLVQLAEVSIN